MIFNYQEVADYTLKKVVVLNSTDICSFYFGHFGQLGLISLQ